MDKSKIMDTADIAITGTTGAGAVELLHQIPTISATGEIIKYICQAIVALVSIWSINKTVKKKKDKRVDSDEK